MDSGLNTPTHTTLLRYGLPYSVNTSQVYPLLAPNGSTIIVCGHEQGILVIWRGGRPFKSEPQTNSHGQNLNGSRVGEETAMDVDEGDSESALDIPIDLSLFEDEEEEVTVAKPYYPIVQDLNLPLGTATLRIAFPHISHAPQDLPHDMTPRLLGTDMVIAAVCADSVTRLLTLPLMPPSSHAKKRLELRNDILIGNAGRGNWGERLIQIPRATGNQGLPKAISVALMPTITLGESEDKVGEDENEVVDNGEDGLHTMNEEWDVLLASCGSDASGEVLIYKVPLSEDGTAIENGVSDMDLLWRSEPIVRSIAALEIYVPTKLRTHEGPYLLLAETNGPVRVYDCCLSSDSNHGRWIRWFYCGFEDNAHGYLCYRTLIDAKWILGGRAIAVLTADGEWGAWNTHLNMRIEMRQPEKRAPSSSKIPTTFIVSGWVQGLSLVTNSTKSSTGKINSRSKLAPMTPSTRKIRESTFFSGSVTRSSISSQGGISTCAMPKALGGKEDDETLVIWHGEKIVMIPSLTTYWENKIRGSGSLFGTEAIGHAREVSSDVLGGEVRSAVSILPLQVKLFSLEKAVKQPDLLVSGDRSLLIISTPLRETRASKPYPREASSSLADQGRLFRGELDVNGMDRILDSMEVIQYVNGDQAKTEVAKKKVLFAK
ncbi:hypothetical protein MMC26_005515 [Xylographa opegraphella]|nr:hypothetical protein [Xylographa opegraphella]